MSSGNYYQPHGGAESNPWQQEQGNPQQQQQHQQPSNLSHVQQEVVPGYQNQDTVLGHQQQQSHTDSNPWGQEAGHQTYEAPSHPPPHQHGSQQQHGFAQDEIPPGLPPRRTGTEAALPQDQDRTHQVEVMQSYEMSRPQTEDEQNQAILQREFPKMDSSLIAAIYGDSGSLSATRELLQELNGTEA